MKLSYDDKRHTYRLNGTMVKGVTSVAGVLDDTYNLQKWGQRMVVLGMSRDTSLAERVKEYGDDRDALDRVAADALTKAGAHEGAERGTAIHGILERYDRGEPVNTEKSLRYVSAEEAEATCAAYQKLLDGAGLKIVPEYIERIVVQEKPFPMAGRFDRLVKRTRDGKLAVLDIKSSENAIEYPHKTAIQLAAYANAPLLAGDLPEEGGVTEEFSKMPENIDKKHGYVIVPDPNNMRIVKIDLVQAGEVLRKYIPGALDWRKASGLVEELGTIQVEDATAPANEDRTAWIRGRLKMLTMVDDTEEAKAMVALKWPAGVATKGPWTENEIDLLDALLIEVETQASAGFPIRDPALNGMKAA